MAQNDAGAKETNGGSSPPAPELQAAIAGLDRVLVTRSYQPLVFRFRPRPRPLFAGPHHVFALDTFAAFASLQSRPHEVWARFFGSSLKDRLRYTPSDCFETFPFPGLGF